MRLFSSRPLVSILLPIYNSERYLRDAIESLLDQTYGNLEILALIEAHNSDSSVELLQSYRDKRIRICVNETKLGLAATLNRGLRLAEGEFVARMDADDIAHSSRIVQQVTLMQRFRRVGLCGTHARLFGDENWDFVPSCEPHKIKVEMLFGCPFVHPTVMFRTELIQKYSLVYDTSLEATEDYDLWSRCIEKFPVANVGSFLLNYRKHLSAATHRHETRGKSIYRAVMAEQLRAFGMQCSEADVDLHYRVFTRGCSNTDELNAARPWFDRLLEQNKISDRYDRKYFAAYVESRFQEFANQAARCSSKVINA